MDFTIFQQLGVAVALASLVGLEREHKYQLDRRYSFAGLRTFVLIGLMGALAYVFFHDNVLIFGVFTLGFLALIVAAYVVTSRMDHGSGATSEVAAILVYIIGVLAGKQLYLIATVVALSILLILHFKDPLHLWAKKMESEELISTIKFIIIAFVILPLLPDKSFGPYDFFNPHTVWLMVVFISGISFVSYIAMKFFDARKGIVLTGFLGGFISSTALTFSFSAESKKNKGIINPYVIAIVVAGTAMFFRVLLEVVVLNPSLFRDIIVPFAVMGVIGISSIVLLILKKEKASSLMQRDVIKIKSPFSLFPALKFGFIFAFILFLTKFALSYVGNSGIYLVSFVSGLMDVDAITVSIANLAKNGLSSQSAAIAITIAAMTNTFFKAMFFLIFGNFRVGLRIGLVFSLIILGGGLTLVFV